jgi:kynureninase
VVTPRDEAQRASVVVARHPDLQRLFELCRERGVDIGAIGGIRVDPAGFNTEADVDRFLACYDEVSG